MKISRFDTESLDCFLVFSVMYDCEIVNNVL